MLLIILMRIFSMGSFFFFFFFFLKAFLSIELDEGGGGPVCEIFNFLSLTLSLPFSHTYFSTTRSSSLLAPTADTS